MKHRSERILAALAVAWIGFAVATIVESALRNSGNRDVAPTAGDGWRLVDREGKDVERSGKRLEIHPTERLSIGRDRAPFHFASVELEFDRLRPNSDLDVALVLGTSGTNDSGDGEIFVRFGSSESFGVMIGKRGIDGSVKLVVQDKTPATIRATSGARRITIRLDHDQLAVEVDGRECLRAASATDLELAAVDLVANGGEIAPRHARVQGRVDDDPLDVLVDPTAGHSPSKIALATAASSTPLGFALFVLLFLAACTTALPPLRRLVLATGIALTPNALLRIATNPTTGLGDGFLASENTALVAAALGLLIGLVVLRAHLAARDASRLENSLRLALGATAVAFAGLSLYRHAHEAFLPLESAERAAVKRVLHPEPESHAAIDLDAGNSLALPNRIRDGELDLRFTLDPDSILQVRLREARPSWPEGVSFFVSRDPRFESGFYLETRGDFVRLTSDLGPLQGDPAAEHALHLEAVGRRFYATLDGAESATATTPMFPQGACRVLAARGRAHVNLARTTPHPELAPLSDGVAADRRAALVDSSRVPLLALLLSCALALGLRLAFPITLLLVGLAMAPLPIALSVVRASPSTGHDELARAVVATLFLLLLPWIAHAKRLQGARTIAFPIHLLLSLLLAQRGRALLDPPIHLVSDEFVSRMPMSHWSGDRLVDDLLWLTHPCFRRWNIYLANHSFRDRAHRVARVPGTLRVMCIGSSSTYGAEAKTPYPLGLERLLEKDGRSVEVINAGVRGSVGNQLVRLLRDQLGQFEPDVVTVSLFYNDAYSLTQSDNEAYLQRVTAAEGGRDRFVDAKFEKEIANGAERYRTLSSAMDESAIAAAAADPDSPPVRFERMLRRFIDLSRERDFRLVFIEEPVRGDEPHVWKKEFRAVMDRLGREFGLPVVDPTPAMQRSGGAKLFVDPIHPNEQGHAIVAETLLPVIEHELDRRAGR